MTRIALSLILLLLLACALSIVGCAQSDPDIIVFYREGCNDCERMDRILEELHGQFPSLTTRRIEIDGPDGELLWALSSEFGIFPTKYPVVFVGDEAITGVGLEKELRLRTAVEECMRSSCESPLERITGPRIPWRTYVIVGLVAVILLAIVMESTL
jgi:hypothetical protein